MAKSLHRSHKQTVDGLIKPRPSFKGLQIVTVSGASLLAGTGLQLPYHTRAIPAAAPHAFGHRPSTESAAHIYTMDRKTGLADPTPAYTEEHTAKINPLLIEKLQANTDYSVTKLLEGNARYFAYPVPVEKIPACSRPASDDVTYRFLPRETLEYLSAAMVKGAKDRDITPTPKLIINTNSRIANAYADRDNRFIFFMGWLESADTNRSMMVDINHELGHILQNKVVDPIDIASDTGRAAMGGTWPCSKTKLPRTDTPRQRLINAVEQLLENEADRQIVTGNCNNPEFMRAVQERFKLTDDELDTGRRYRQPLSWKQKISQATRNSHLPYLERYFNIEDVYYRCKTEADITEPLRKNHSSPSR
jgi:hypothetical protein